MKKILLVVAGFMCLILGGAGVVLPLLPTTPLVLLAAICFSSSNKKIEAWLIRSRLFGPFIENYRTGRGISKQRKIFTIAFLWTGLICSMYFIGTIMVCILLCCIGVGVTVHLLMLKTAK